MNCYRNIATRQPNLTKISIIGIQFQSRLYQPSVYRGRTNTLKGHKERHLNNASA